VNRKDELAADFYGFLNTAFKNPYHIHLLNKNHFNKLMDFPKFDELIEDLVQYHTEAIDFDLPNSTQITTWVEATIKAEENELSSLNFIFCDDTYLHKINLEYLDHDTLTDVITFPYTDKGAPIEGDIYISIDRIKENATKFEVPFLKELERVMIHGVLHLCGYGDKSKKEEKVMREKENFYLEKLNKG